MTQSSDIARWSFAIPLCGSWKSGRFLLGRETPNQTVIFRYQGHCYFVAQPSGYFTRWHTIARPTYTTWQLYTYRLHWNAIGHLALHLDDLRKELKCRMEDCKDSKTRAACEALLRV